MEAVTPSFLVIAPRTHRLSPSWGGPAALADSVVNLVPWRESIYGRRTWVCYRYVSTRPSRYRHGFALERVQVRPATPPFASAPRLSSPSLSAPTSGAQFHHAVVPPWCSIYPCISLGGVDPSVITSTSGTMLVAIATATMSPITGYDSPGASGINVHNNITWTLNSTIATGVFPLHTTLGSRHATASTQTDTPRRSMPRLIGTLAINATPIPMEYHDRDRGQRVIIAPHITRTTRGEPTHATGVLHPVTCSNLNPSTITENIATTVHPGTPKRFLVFSHCLSTLLLSFGRETNAHNAI